MDEKAMREYALKARKEGRTIHWIANALSIRLDQAHRLVNSPPHTSGFKITWPEGFFDDQENTHQLPAAEEISSPVPDAVWTSAREFHCPICNEAGSSSPLEQLCDPVLYTAPHGHPDLGDGNFTCPFAGENRPWTVSKFQNRPGGAVAESDQVPGSLTWLQYHDQLVQEWFDGERERVDDLYPSKPERTPSDLAAIRRKVLPHNLYTCSTLMFTACAALKLLDGSIFLAILWFTIAAMHYTLAFKQAKRS